MSWAYIAGLFDGEGCIQFRQRGVGQNGKPWFGIKAQIVQSNRHAGEKTLLEVRDFLVTNGICCHVRKRTFTTELSRNDIFELEIGGRKAVWMFIKEILPHAHIRRTDLLDYLRFLVLFPKFRRPGVPLSEHNPHPNLSSPSC